jgi:lysophospholipase L1-like esterase
MAVIVWAAVALPSDRGLAYGGWLGVGALVTAALIVGLQASGSLRALLSTAPFVALGRISYGVYLFHWPVFLLVVSGVGWSQFALRAAITIALAAVSFRLIEYPARVWTAPRRAVASFATAGTAGVVVLALITVSAPTTSFGAGAALEARVRFGDDVGSLGELRPSSTDVAGPTTTATSFAESVATSVAPASASATTTPLPVPDRPVRILVIGDSTGVALSNGFVQFAYAHPELAQVEVLAEVGCGLMSGASTMFGDESHVFQRKCDHALGRLPGALTERPPDVVVVMVTIPDAIERTWPGEAPLVPADPLYAARLETDYRAMADRLLATPGVKVAWLAAAPPAAWSLERLHPTRPPYDLSASAAAITTLAGERPDRIQRVDLASWLEAREAAPVDGVDTHFWRPDGLHFDPAASLAAVEQYLWPQVVTFALS